MEQTLEQAWYDGWNACQRWNTAEPMPRNPYVTKEVTVEWESDEWVCVVYENGKRNEAATYYAGDDKQDAISTAKVMRESNEG